jgi:hypothetical protein
MMLIINSVLFLALPHSPKSEWEIRIFRALFDDCVCMSGSVVDEIHPYTIYVHL